jgi:pimeloyl-ACP methyl ester carboxylesterase
MATSEIYLFISSYYAHWLLSLSIQELVEELGIYLLAFDRAGYGESDPNPKRGVKSEALDIEELADQLELGQKFYVLGTSMGGYSVWGCLQYIPHRQA